MNNQRNGNIYWINGQNRADRYHLAQKLRDFLKTERRNWRRDVFYIDNDTFEESSIEKALIVADYISDAGVDVVIALNIEVKPVKDMVKLTLGDRFIDVLIHNSKKLKSNVTYDETYDLKESYSISIDTTLDTPTQAFNKLICELRNLNFL